MPFSDHAVLVGLFVVWGVALGMLALAIAACWCFCCLPWGFRKGLFGVALVTMLVAIFSTALLTHRVQELWDGSREVVQSSLALARLRMK
jgi:uncharacterized membrane protein